MEVHAHSHSARKKCLPAGRQGRIIFRRGGAGRNAGPKAPASG